MDTNAIALAKEIKTQYETFKKAKQYSHIAKLITYALLVNPTEYNRQIFGYIPQIFREIEINLNNQTIQPENIFIGEPVIYKIYYPQGQKLYNIPFFYIFCYLKESSQKLNIHFQSAHPQSRKLGSKDYDINLGKINFEGCMSAFDNNDISVISVSDPGHFIPGFTSSYYLGTAEFNFVELISKLLEDICNLSGIFTYNTILFGSSAGTFGALLSSTYFKQKINVLALNSQVFLQYRKTLMNLFFNLTNPQELLEKFGNQISCNYRFKQEIKSIPNIYILANINDDLYPRNFEFYQLYLNNFTRPGQNNQSVFDSYYGVEGHGRPETTSLKAKIRIAREILTMKSNADQ